MILILELPSQKRIHGLLDYPLEIIDLMYFSSFHESSSVKVPWNISFTLSDSDELIFLDYPSCVPSCNHNFIAYDSYDMSYMKS